MAIRNVVILVVAVVVLGGAWWLSTQYDKTVPSEEEEQTTEVVTRGDLHYTENTDLYTIDIAYPDIANSAAAVRVEEIVQEEVTRFKEGNVALIDQAETTRIREMDRRYELSAEYETYTSEDFISYVFSIYLDTGGAHPNSFFRTVVFDENGEEWLLADIFVEGAPYLSRLSEEAYTRVLAELTSRAGGEVTPEMEEGVRLGTAPSSEAIQFFYLNNDELHLLFPPYQVAAYAAGSFDIVIPLSELQDILRPEIQ